MFKLEMNLIVLYMHQWQQSKITFFFMIYDMQSITLNYNYMYNTKNHLDQLKRNIYLRKDFHTEIWTVFDYNLFIRPIVKNGVIFKMECKFLSL